MAYLLLFYHHVKVTTSQPTIQLVAPELRDAVLNGFMRFMTQKSVKKIKQIKGPVS